MPDAQMTTFNFSVALEKLKAGNHVTRLGWNGKGMWLELQVPDANSKMTRPYIYINIADGGRVPWVASNGDLLGDDWCVF